MKRTAVWFALLLAGAAPLWAQDTDSKLEKVSAMRTFFNIGDDLLKAPMKNVKVAILSDALTEGAIKDRKLVGDRYLPDSAEWIDSYGNLELELSRKIPLGRKAAQIIWGLTGYDTGPAFRLYNVNGLRNFREAVNDLIDWKADVVLCLKNFEGMGNFDGRGFVNKLVEKATDEGILWVQSAGEYHGKVLNVPVKAMDAKTPDTVFYKVASLLSRADSNPVKLNLSWNAYAPGSDVRPTDKDLDLFLYEPGTSIAWKKAEVKQAPTAENKSGNYPIETLIAELSVQEKPYDVWIAHRGGTFSPERDKVRLTVLAEKKPYIDGDDQKLKQPVELLDPSNREEIMVPADNREVITVGDLGPESSVGPTADGREKPDIVLDEYPAQFSDKTALNGPHAAAAYLAAAVVVMRANVSGLRTKHVLQIAQKKPDGDGTKTSKRWKTPSLSELQALVK